MNAPATATLAELRAAQAPAAAMTNLPAVRMGFDTPQGFDLLQRASKAFASSDLVPKQYTGNIANCMIALEMSGRIGASPMMVMQNLYIVHGQPGWSAKFLIACINSSGRFTALRYEWRGKPGDADYGCRAWAIEHATGERLDGIWVDWKMVKAEGWDGKSGSKWKTMADQMFVYRSATFWQRAYAPEISMGMLTDDEIRDVVDVSADGRVTVTSEAMRADLKTVRPENAGDPAEPPAAERAAAKRPSAAKEKPEAPPAPTYAEVEAALRGARSLDDLDAAADLIGMLTEGQRADATAEYRRLRGGMES